MKIDQKSAISEALLAQLQDLGSRLSRLRIARGVRQEEAALRAGISRRTVVAIESGAPSVAIGQIVRLLDAIAPGKTLSSLFTETDPSVVALVHSEQRQRARKFSPDRLKELDF
jgi:transcriptional regulator with XRE-family HTH domain